MKLMYTVLYVLLLIGLFLTEFFHPITAINVDLGRHLLLGKIIVQTHHVPKTNLLSYTYKNSPYINSSWLTDVIYYLLFQLGEFNLLLIINTLLILFAFGLLIRNAAKTYPSSLATLLSITLYLLLLGLRPDIRPEVMSMVCMALFINILYASYRGNKTKLLYLIPVELLWVNTHIYFFVGPLLILIFLFDALLSHHVTTANSKQYLFALAGTILATLINPNGFKGAIFPFTVLQNYGVPVTENQSIPILFITYHATQILLPVFVIMLLFLILIAARKNTRPIDWLLTVIFSIATIIFFRNVLLFVFATFITFTTQANFLANKYSSFIKKLPTFSYFSFYPLSLLLLALFIISSIKINGFGFGVTAYGKNAVDLLLANTIKEPIYNNFDVGDYLSYRLYPQLVFVDNRPEAYPASFFQNIYTPMQNNPQLFEKIDKNYHFNALIIEYWDSTPWGNNLLRYLVNDSAFKLVYLDQNMILLVRNTKGNKRLITQYLITKKLQINDLPNTQLLHDLFFFEKVGWTQQINKILVTMRKTDPQLCILLHYPLEKTNIQAYITAHHLNKNCSFSFSS